MMVWKLWPTKTKTTSTRSYQQLTNDEQFDIEQRLSSGTSPMDLSREYGVPAAQLYGVRRQLTGTTTTRAGTADPEIVEIRREMERVKAQAELERIKAETDLARQERELNIKLKQLEISEREAELYDDDEDDELDIDDFDKDPEGALLSFFTTLMQKQNVGAPQSPQGGIQTVSGPAPDLPQAQRYKLPQMDWTRDATPEDIKFEMELVATPGEIEQLAKLPDQILEKGLRARYSGISEKNITEAIKQIRNYGA